MTAPITCPTCDAHVPMEYLGEDLYRCTHCGALADEAELTALWQKEQLL